MNLRFTINPSIGIKMKKLDKLTIIGILTTIVLVFLINTHGSLAYTLSSIFTISPSSTSSNETPNITNITMEKRDFYIYPSGNLDIGSYVGTTKTGLKLEMKNVYNPTNNTDFVVDIFNGEKWAKFNITIDHNSTWSYALINGILVVPAHSGLYFDSTNTNYYKFNKQLKVSTKGGDGVIYIYTEEKPSRVVANVSIKWYYNDSTNVLVIKLLSNSNHTFVVDWTEYPVMQGTIFVEDRTGIEEMEYEKSNLEKELEKYNKLLTELNNRLNYLENVTANLTSEYSDLTNKLNKLINEKTEIQNKITEYNKTKTMLEEKLKDKTIISPFKAALIVIFLIFLIGYMLLVQFERIAPQTVENIKMFSLGEKNE